MGWRSALMLALVACGRVGFDARDDGDEVSDTVGDVDADLGDAADEPSDLDSSDDSAACAASDCEASDGTCEGGTCVIEGGPGTFGVVQCPPGVPCEVRCEGFGACSQGVDCDDASACVVSCLGDGACQGGVDCGTSATCNVTCGGGMGACQMSGVAGTGAVNCRESICDVVCEGFISCQAGISVEPGGMCTSHCCGGACQGGFGDCVNDTMCP